VRAATTDAGALWTVHTDDGRALDATFRVEPVGTTLAVIIESGGGTRDSKGARNRDYGAGLRIADALVDSGQVAKLSNEERRLAMSYPIAIEDATALRKELGRAMARTGPRESAKGAGDPEKRLRLVLEGTELSAAALAGMLGGNEAVGGS
jgi:hypothetical protein